MKQRLSITILLITMFIVTQAIGLFVIKTYFPEGHQIDSGLNLDKNSINQTNISESKIPYGLDAPEGEVNFFALIFNFAIAIALVMILMKYKWKMVIRLWFLFVIILAIAIALNAIFLHTNLANTAIIALILAIPLAILKVFKPSAFTHNITELLIYPGISIVFVPILSPISAVVLLAIISVYDMWMVWKTGMMQKMAKFQMEEIKVFGGFLLTSAPKEVREEIKMIKQKYKGKEIPKKYKNKKFKVSLAILGGGDVVFPLITAGVFLNYYGGASSLFVLFGALMGLLYLFCRTEKGKSYPAMPYITTGILIGIIAGKIFGIF